MFYKYYVYFFFFFKQKTAYEMRISDWSSDVCSSDLLRTAIALAGRSTIGPFVISRCLARPQQPGCSKAGGGRCGQEHCWLLPSKTANFLGQFAGRFIVELVGQILNRSRCLAYQ